MIRRLMQKVGKKSRWVVIFTAVTYLLIFGFIGHAVYNMNVRSRMPHVVSTPLDKIPALTVRSDDPKRDVPVPTPDPTTVPAIESDTLMTPSVAISPTPVASTPVPTPVPTPQPLPIRPVPITPCGGCGSAQTMSSGRMCPMTTTDAVSNYVCVL